MKRRKDSESDEGPDTESEDEDFDVEKPISKKNKEKIIEIDMDDLEEMEEEKSGNSNNIENSGDSKNDPHRNLSSMLGMAAFLECLIKINIS